MKKKLIDLIEHLNAEANRDWRDDRHIELNSCLEDGEDLLIDFSLGKFEKVYYLVRVNYNGWKIQGSAGYKNANIEDFMRIVMHKLYNL